MLGGAYKKQGADHRRSLCSILTEKAYLRVQALFERIPIIGIQPLS